VDAKLFAAAQQTGYTTEPSIYDRMMECLITSLRFELFENIIHMELDGTLANNEAIGNVAIAKRSALAKR
jgi:hypothetical protein